MPYPWTSATLPVRLNTVWICPNPISWSSDRNLSAVSKKSQTVSALTGCCFISGKTAPPLLRITTCWRRTAPVFPRISCWRTRMMPPFIFLPAQPVSRRPFYIIMKAWCTPAKWNRTTTARAGTTFSSASRRSTIPVQRCTGSAPCYPAAKLSY